MARAVLPPNHSGGRGDCSGRSARLAATSKCRPRNSTRGSVQSRRIRSTPSTSVLAGAGEPERQGNRHPQNVPENEYPSADGQSIVIEVRDDAGWARLAAAMKQQPLAEDARYASAAARRRHAGEVDRLVATWVAERTAEEAVRACQEARVAAGPVLSVGEVATHPHTLAREMVVLRDHPTLGPIRLLGVPLKLTRPEPRVVRTAPALGAHNTEVYGELAGQSAERLQALRAAGVM
jgi:crotonobetainyl-CoA:carnitine CoA-transferase CaiB-like acyl-CoA transferase